MTDHPIAPKPGKHRRIGLFAMLVAAAGAGIGALGGRAFRVWRSSPSRLPSRASSMATEHLLGEGMAKKKQAAQTGDSAAVYLRLDSMTLARLDAFAATNDASSRAEAARALILSGLDRGPPLPEGDEHRFKAGDRVTTNRHGAGVITEGPIHSVHYAVTFDEPSDSPPPRVNERGLKPA